MPSLVGPLALWSFSSLAGVRPPDAPAAARSPAAFAPASSPGFRHVVVKPNVGVGNVSWMRSSMTLPRGELRVEWYLAPARSNATRGGRVRLLVDVPAGATATVHVPTLNAASVTERGQPAGGAASVAFRGQFGDRAIFDVASGDYAFEADFGASDPSKA